MNKQDYCAGLVEGFLLAHNAPSVIVDAFASIQDGQPKPVDRGVKLTSIIVEEMRSESKKPRKPRKPLSEENKEKLRNQLKTARAAKATKKSESKAAPHKVAKIKN